MNGQRQTPTVTIASAGWTFTRAISDEAATKMLQDLSPILLDELSPGNAKPGKKKYKARAKKQDEPAPEPEKEKRPRRTKEEMQEAMFKDRKIKHDIAGERE